MRATINVQSRPAAFHAVRAHAPKGRASHASRALLCLSVAAAVAFGLLPSLQAQERARPQPGAVPAPAERSKPPANVSTTQDRGKSSPTGDMPSDRPKYTVTGFRDIRFGMTEPEVRTAVLKSFGLKEADVASGTNAAEGTTLLVARVPSLEPGPGPATVTYIFGHKSKRLIQINVAWGEEQARQSADPSAMIGAGTRLGRYFEGFAWRKDATRVGIPVGDNTVVLFAGEDEGKGAVRVVIDGVRYQVVRESQQATSPEPKGPAKLILNYIADRETPDIATIERGKF